MVARLGNKLVMRDFATPPLEERPRAVNLAALRKLRIGPIWPSDPDREVGMRGVPDPKGTSRRWVEYRSDRARRRRASRATRRAQR
jgi:hypothetical protein